MTSSPVADPQLAADANVSVDVDGLDCYRDIHGLPQPPQQDLDPIWTVGVERARQLFAEFDLSATFFVVGRDLQVEEYRQQTAALADDGHEIANHTLDHPYDLPQFFDAEIGHQLSTTDDLIADVTGEPPVGFRAPGYNINADIIAFSRRCGHRYDASVFPCITYWAAKAAVLRIRRLLGNPSRSDETDPRNLTAPREPYFPDPLDCWRPSPTTKRYVEIPVASFAARTLPVIGTSLHLLDTIGFERLWPVVDRSFPHFFNLEMHALDFLDATDLDGVADAQQLVDAQPDLRIDWQQKRTRYTRVLDAICQTRSPDTLRAATAPIGAN